MANWGFHPGPFERYLSRVIPGPFERYFSRVVPGPFDVIRKEAWSFYRTSSGVRLYWELEEPKGPSSVRGLSQGTSRIIQSCVAGPADQAGPCRFTQGPSSVIRGVVLGKGGRSWSHFVGIYRQKLRKSSKMTFFEVRRALRVGCQTPFRWRSPQVLPNSISSSSSLLLSRIDLSDTKG